MYLHLYLQRKHGYTGNDRARRSISFKQHDTTQSKLDDIFVQRTSKFDPKNPRQVAITEAICDFVALDMMPLNLVNGRGFAKLMAVLEPRYQMMSRQTITNRIAKKVKGEIVAKIKEEVSTIPTGNVHTTSDLWTSRRRESIIGCRLHYITDGWTCKSVSVGLDFFSGRHTGENVCSSFEKLLDSVGLYPHHIGVNVTDSAANMIKAFRLFNELLISCAAESTSADNEGIHGVAEVMDELVDEEDSMFEDVDSLLEGMDETRISCNAHDLQLVVNKALSKSKSVSSLLSHCSTIVKFYHKSSHWHQVLVDRAGKGLITYCKTRWNGSLLMLRRLSEVNSNIMHVIFT